MLYHFDENSKLGSYIYEMLQDDAGNVWVSTMHGIARIDSSSLEVTMTDSYADNMALCGGRLWFSSQGKIYVMGDDLKAMAVGRQDGYGLVHALVSQEERIWFTTSETVCFIDGSTLEETTVSGNPDFLCTGIYNPARKEILLGGEDRLYSYSTDYPAKERHLAEVKVTALLSGGERLAPFTGFSGGNPRFSSHINLPERMDISVVLSTLSYGNDETFYYRIGKAGVWTRLEDGHNHIPFVNAPGGEMTLSLACADPELYPQAPVSSYFIRIPRPWYASVLALAAYILVFAAAVVLTILRIQKKNREKYERLEKERYLELAGMKMDFFVNISHELKTPLSLIIAPVSRLLGEVKDQAQKDLLSTINDNAQRLNTLIHKILDLKQTEVESDDVLIRSRTELNSQIRNCIKSFSPALEDKDISLDFSTDTDTVWANIDIIKLDSVFVNLISNAIKYVKPHEGRIKIETSVKGGDFVFTISDNGAGISKEELSLVFIRYFQGKTRSQRAPGTGIGLYLVKKYVELHGGAISISSNTGTKICFSIPLTGENAPVSQTANHESTVTQDTSATLLIVDDNEELLGFLSESLSLRHYACRTAGNAKKALSVLRNETVDLIITDEMMPEMDGLEFVRHIRRQRKTAAVPIIMLTAKDDSKTELESIQAGVDAFLSKPFDMKKLQLRIAQLLSKRRELETTVRIERLSNPDFEDSTDILSSDEMLLEKVTKVIEENIGNENLTVNMLSDAVALDQKQLYRKLRQLTGFSPISYIRKLRMKKAAILLQQNRFTVAEIMYLVGYSNASYFAKCFAEEFGSTPKEYAATHKVD